jgi:hypothetical protein
MPRRPTASVPRPDLLAGDTPTLIYARTALPLLVLQAKAEQTITYAHLAKLVGMPNHRNLNTVLGAIGNSLLELAKQRRGEIPPIQGLVVNKRTKLPGYGIGTFLSHRNFEDYSVTQQRKILHEQLGRVYAYPGWDLVLEQLELVPLHVNLMAGLQGDSRPSGGESAAHLRLKEFVAANPAVVGLPVRLGAGLCEHLLQSGDRLDVHFTHYAQRIAVEVKSRVSDEQDVLRGLLQCVKYRVLIEAEQLLAGDEPNSRVLLVLEGSLPPRLRHPRYLLGVDVIENVVVK